MNDKLPSKTMDNAIEILPAENQGPASVPGVAPAGAVAPKFSIWRFGLALATAMAADVLFALITPAEGLEVVGDVVVAIILCVSLGFSWVLLPTLLVEAIPGLDVFPCWTLAVLGIAGFKIMKSKA